MAILSTVDFDSRPPAKPQPITAAAFALIAPEGRGDCYLVYDAAPPYIALSSDGTTFDFLIYENPIAGNLVDANTLIVGSGDATKKARFEVDGITAGQTRVMTIPNFDGTLATLAGTETLTNKTLTSPALNTPTVTTPTLSGGTIDNTPVGTTTRALGYFSALREYIGGFAAIFTHANSADRTYTLPNATTTLVGTDTTQTLTNKSIDASQLTGTLPGGTIPAPDRVYTDDGNNQNITTANSANLTFADADKYDVGSWHDTVTNNDRFELPSAGIVSANCFIQFTAGASAGRVKLRLYWQDTSAPASIEIASHTINAVASQTLQSINVSCPGIYIDDAADYLYADVRNDSGATVGVTYKFFSAVMR